MASGRSSQAFLRGWIENEGRLIPPALWESWRFVTNHTLEHEVRFRAEDHRAIKRTGLDLSDLFLRGTDPLGYRVRRPLPGLLGREHIHQHARSGNDDPRNGLALTLDAHWMFDAGLWTAEGRGNDFVMRVAKGRFQEGSAYGRSLLEREGKSMVFDARARLRPGTEFLGWHGSQSGLC